MSRRSVAPHGATGQVHTYPTRNFATLGPFIPLHRQQGSMKASASAAQGIPGPPCRHGDRTISSSV